MEEINVFNISITVFLLLTAAYLLYALIREKENSRLLQSLAPFQVWRDGIATSEIISLSVGYRIESANNQIVVRSGDGEIVFSGNNIRLVKVNIIVISQ